jgi:recombinational DNA repair protein (RecF pathway)
MWSLNFEKCQDCGTTKVKHHARGLCRNCYEADAREKHRAHPRKRGVASKKLTKEYLLDEYVRKEKSLIDIARNCDCSRQYVYQKLKSYNIPSRSKSIARRIALRKEKLFFEK